MKDTKQFLKDMADYYEDIFKKIEENKDAYRANIEESLEKANESELALKKEIDGQQTLLSMTTDMDQRRDILDYLKDLQADLEGILAYKDKVSKYL